MSDKEKKKMADSEAGPRPRRRGGIRAALFFLLLGVAIGVVITRGLPTRDSLERSWDQSRRWTRERLDGAREALDEPLSDAAREAEETWREVSKKTGETAREAAKSAEGALRGARERARELKPTLPDLPAAPELLEQIESLATRAAKKPASAPAPARGAASPNSGGGHFLYGPPRGAPESNRIVEREIYTLSANKETKFADWVAYRLTPRSIEGGGAKTERVWRADPELPEDYTLEPEDYRGAFEALQVDRGHQAPLAGFRGSGQWADTNYLSNITPQKSALNQGPWNRLEEKERALVREYGEVFVLTGPLYEREMPPLPNADEPHKVPSGYWKILAVQPDPGDPAALQTAAFLMDQNAPRDTAPMKYLSTVNEIERRSGLNFFADLPDTIEESLESSDNRDWAEKRF